jgi:hypothetical protein
MLLYPGAAKVSRGKDFQTFLLKISRFIADV